jgi:hypothetical protein
MRPYGDMPETPEEVVMNLAPESYVQVQMKGVRRVTFKDGHVLEIDSRMPAETDEV